MTQVTDTKPHATSNPVADKKGPVKSTNKRIVKIIISIILVFLVANWLMERANTVTINDARIASHVNQQ